MNIRKDYLPFGRPNFSEAEVEAVSRVMRSGWIGMGSETIRFENELAEFIGAPYVVTVNSCTSALFLSLIALDIRPGDEVICPSLTWCSTANIVLYLKAKPVFCDVNPKTLCLSPETVLKKVSKKTKAVIAVHFGGLAIDVSGLRSALPESVQVIEDAAHAFGSRFTNGKHVGTSGYPTCFSFYANKNLSTGEGGAIALYCKDTCERLQSLRQHALPIDAWKRFKNPKSILLSNQLTELGYKMNYTDLQSAIGRVQLERFEEMQNSRQKIADIYYNELKDVGVEFQEECNLASHAKHLFVIQLPLEQMRHGRDDIILSLRAKNIGASIHYAPLHLMPLYLDGKRPEVLPVTETLAKTLITLPISASMDVEDARYVTKAMTELLQA